MIMILFISLLSILLTEGEVDYKCKESEETETCCTAVANCGKCDSGKTKCTGCADGFTATFDGTDATKVTTCTATQTDYTCKESEETETCCTAVANCGKCDSGKTKCTGCADGFTATFDGTDATKVTKCTAPITCSVQHCKKCVAGNPNSCETCESGYTKSSDGKTCNPIPITSQCDDINCENCDTDISKCTLCKDNYGLRNGQCTLCADGYWENGYTMCKNKCTIENCKSCNFENGVEYCTYCEDFYEVNDDHKSCRLRTCSESFDGCAECNSTEPPFVCTKCDTSKNWNEKPSPSGFCTCIENYVDADLICISQEEVCPDSDSFGCIRCDKSGKCIECYPGLNLKDGVCGYNEVKCPMSHCAKCASYQGFVGCLDCEEGYTSTDDGQYCYKDNAVECTTTIPGCLKCYEGLTDKCKVCDTENHFVNSKLDINFGTCVCDPEYDFVDGKCIPPIGPVEPPELNLTDITDYLVQKDGGYTIDTSNTNFPKPDGYDGFEAKVGDSISGVLNIPSGLSNVVLDLSDRTQPLQLKPDSKVNVVFTKPTTITIPANTNNVDLTGSGKITINPDNDKATDITLDKITPQGASGIEIENSNQNIDITQVQVFKKTKLIGQTNEKTTTTCEKILLEGGSELDVEHVTVKEVFIGIKSVFNVATKDVTFKDSNFHLYYNRSLGSGAQQFPIVIKNDVLPEFGSAKINVIRSNEGDLITLDAVEELPIIKLESDNEKYCNEKLKPMFTDSADFANAECQKSTSDGKTSYNLIAKKQQQKEPKDDDGGLSAGAIAGIVIACIVVVAAIIALLVYFLVIKKKNRSTTSTQGDSSIAI